MLHRKRAAMEPRAAQAQTTSAAAGDNAANTAGAGGDFVDVTVTAAGSTGGLVIVTQTSSISNPTPPPTSSSISSFSSSSTSTPSTTSSATPKPTSTHHSNDSSIAPVTIGGIVAGAVLGVLAIGLAIIFTTRRLRRRGNSDPSSLFTPRRRHDRRRSYNDDLSAPTMNAYHPDALPVRSPSDGNSRYNDYQPVRQISPPAQARMNTASHPGNGRDYFGPNANPPNPVYQAYSPGRVGQAEAGLARNEHGGSGRSGTSGKSMASDKGASTAGKGEGWEGQYSGAPAELAADQNVQGNGVYEVEGESAPPKRGWGERFSWGKKPYGGGAGGGQHF